MNEKLPMMEEVERGFKEKYEDGCGKGSLSCGFLLYAGPDEGDDGSAQANAVL